MSIAEMQDLFPVLAGDAARDYMVRWARARGLTIYECTGSNKHPRKVCDMLPDGTPIIDYERWNGRTDAKLLIRIPRGDLIADADGPTGVEAVQSVELEDHLWIRSAKGTEKHFLTTSWLGRRVIRGLPDLDILVNPDGLPMWCKIWDEGYEVHPGPMPEAPAILTELKPGRLRIARNPSGKLAVEGATGWRHDELLHYAIDLGDDPRLTDEQVRGQTHHHNSEFELPQEDWEVEEILDWVIKHRDAPEVPLCQKPAKPQVEAFVPSSSKRRKSKGDKCSDQRVYITKTTQLARKIQKNEGNDHPKSRDWETAPERTWKFYDEVLYPAWYGSLHRGGQYADAPKVIATGWSAELEWLLHGNNYPLVEIVGSVIRALDDRPPDKEDPFPGAPAGVNPKAGKRLGQKLVDLLTALRNLPCLRKRTRKEITMLVNSPGIRKVWGLEECCYASVDAVKKAEQRAGITMVRKPVLYRNQHRWAMAEAPVYSLPENAVIPLHNKLQLEATVGMWLHEREVLEEMREELAS